MDTIRNILSTLGTLELPMIGISDIIEILILAFLVYHVLVWVQNTRTWSVIQGLVILLACYFLASLLQLNTIVFLMQRAAGVAVTGALIVFQPELRKALEQLGQGNRIFSFVLNDSRESNSADLETIEELVKSAFVLGRARTGALIVIERTTTLEEYVRTGIGVDAILTGPLLINIFEHNTPLHDGAVIIRGNRVISATCYLPLSQNPAIPKALGTRHRAAIGVSEVTDSLTIVVSEETGQVSLAENGELTHGLTQAELRERLSVLYTPLEKSKKTSSLNFRMWRKGRVTNERNDS